MKVSLHLLFTLGLDGRQWLAALETFWVSEPVWKKCIYCSLMFCRPFIIVYQYSKATFLFNLVRIKGLYMFRILLAHPQDVLHKQHLVCCVRIMSVGCTRIGVISCSPRESNSDISSAQYPEPTTAKTSYTTSKCFLFR
jgi:hypothetical protein